MKLSHILSTRGKGDGDGKIKRHMKTSPAAGITTVKHWCRPSLAAHANATALRAAPRRKRSRKLSRQQQERWVEKEADNSLIYNLTLDVNELKQQVQRLAMEKRARETRASVSHRSFECAAIRTAERFLQILAGGFRAMQPDEQQFLTASTHEAVAVGAVAFGHDMLFQQWEYYMRNFSMHAFTSASVAVMSSDAEYMIVCCDGMFDGRISRATVEIVFPHILADEVLVQRVVGHSIRVPIEALLYFDASNRIVRFDSNVDIFKSLNDLLTLSPRDVITMMACAQVNDMSMITDHAPSYSEQQRQQQLKQMITDDSANLQSTSPVSPSRYVPIVDVRHSVNYILS